MKSVTTERFRKAYDQLPESIKEQARKAYQRWTVEPYHPGLAFKQVSTRQPVFSVRIGMNYRAMGVREDDTMIWFWIGSHEDYNNLIKQL